MNYTTLRVALHDELDNLIDKCREQDPDEGIIDLALSFLHVDGLDESTTLNANSELVDLADGSWEVEATSIWIVKHIHHLGK